MTGKRDDRTQDLFIPMPVVSAPGSANYAATVSELVAEILKGTPLDRYEVAARMSRLSCGPDAESDVTKFMLDAWSAPGRPDHNIPFYRVPLLEEVCESHLLTNWLVPLRGGRVAYGRDALLAELGRLERVKEAATKQARELRKLIGGGEA